MTTPPDLDELAARARELRAQGPRGRYAPSPTGPLHLGNVRTALLAWLQVRLAGGTLLMRIEDLDEPRAVEGSAAQLMDELGWLGLDWDEGPRQGGPVGPYTQSERGAIYEQALARLERQGLVFACYCSRKDIREATSAPHEGYTVYPGTCRGLDEGGRARVAEEKGWGPAWRMIAPSRRVALEDRIAGPFAQQLDEEVGDFVIMRRDGLFAYQLAVVVDDALMGVTDVVRGEDLLSSTPRQIAIFEALGWPVPRFWHVPMMTDARGERLSKRDGSRSVAALREEEGLGPADIIGRLAASAGLLERPEPITPAALLERLDEQRLRRALRP